MATKRARESSAAEANGNPSDGAVMSPAEKKVRAEVGAEAAAAVATGAGSRRFSLAREPDTNRYMAGFGNEFQSEALPDSLPVGQNTPQVCPRNLFAEQLSGTSFTTPRDRNERTWFYRIHPSVGHRPFVPAPTSPDFVSDFSQCVGDPNQTRWTPFPLPAEGSSVTFAEGLRTVCGSGSAESKSGLAVHVYTCNAPMVDQAICNSDGDFLVVPQLGLLDVRTEMGLMRVQPGEIFVVPRGIKFSVAVTGPSRGYVLECFSGHYRIPDLGPIGANGLANPRDFLTPVAAFEDRRCEFTVLQKYLGRFWAARYDRSPFDVVAWFGNYVPYKYDLSRFVVINSVSVDHLDPSIFTVLTCPTNEPGVACADFVIFPPRWAVQEGTFRPPYYHRNCMAEFMGNILGKYDAKPNGFLPGSATLHSCMIPHGPDRDAFSHGSSAALAPTHMEGGLAFMFETTYMMRLTKWALSTNVDKDYYKCWEGLEVKFDGKN